MSGSNLGDNTGSILGDIQNARDTWNRDDSIDAWLIWNHWRIDDPDIADLVPTEPEMTIYRDTSIALTEKGKDNDEVTQCNHFLKSDKGVEILPRMGGNARLTDQPALSSACQACGNV